MKTKTQELINKNFEMLIAFFKKESSKTIYNGNWHKLYLNIENGEIFYTEEPSPNTYTPDFSMFEILRVHSHSQERNIEFLLMSDRELYNHGFKDWLDEIEKDIGYFLRNQISHFNGENKNDN